jgi:hypothetical protein
VWRIEKKILTKGSQKRKWNIQRAPSLEQEGNVIKRQRKTLLSKG